MVQTGIRRSSTLSRLDAVNAQPTALARLRALVLTPAQLLPLALAQLGALWLIVGTGAAVRLTDSGLGCRDWPGCEAGHPLPAKNAHAFVEFGNRLVGAITIAVTLLTWLAVRRTPALSPRARYQERSRRDSPGARSPSGGHDGRGTLSPNVSVGKIRASRQSSLQLMVSPIAAKYAASAFPAFVPGAPSSTAGTSST